MEDIKQMIENAKQKLADEKEKARKLVEENERLNAELEAALMPAQAPSPSATELDRIVAVVDKINEKADITDKLRVQSVAGLRKGIEMIGGDGDLTLTSQAWNEKRITETAFVIDITSLTTQDAVFQKAEVNKFYKMPKLISGWNGQEPLLQCVEKDATSALFSGTANYPGELYSLSAVFNAGVTDPATLAQHAYIPYFLGKPTNVAHAATKGYVDTAVAPIANKQDTLTKTMTITYDNGSTETIKVG